MHIIHVVTCDTFCSCIAHCISLLVLWADFVVCWDEIFFCWRDEEILFCWRAGWRIRFMYNCTFSQISSQYYLHDVDFFVTFLHFISVFVLCLM